MFFLLANVATNSPKKKRFSPHFVASSLEWKRTMPNYFIFKNFSILYLLYKNEMDIIQKNPHCFVNQNDGTMSSS